MANRYKWTRSFGVDAQVAGEWIYSLPDRSAEAIVDSARSKKSPLHSIFDWDDASAARQQRLHLARIMVNSLEVEVIQSSGKPRRIAAYIASSERGRYVATLEASSDELTAAEAKCLDEMRRFKERWKGIQLARTVIDAIADIDRSVRRRKKRA